LQIQQKTNRNVSLAVSETDGSRETVMRYRCINPDAAELPQTKLSWLPDGGKKCKRSCTCVTTIYSHWYTPRHVIHFATPTVSSHSQGPNSQMLS